MRPTQAFIRWMPEIVSAGNKRPRSRMYRSYIYPSIRLHATALEEVSPGTPAQQTDLRANSTRCKMAGKYVNLREMARVESAGYCVKKNSYLVLFYVGTNTNKFTIDLIYN
jgi:hypothetical protein